MEKIQKFILKNKSLIFCLFGAFLFFIPVFFLDNIFLSGIFCIVGLFILLHMCRMAEDRKTFLIYSLILYLSYVFRFIHIFERNFLNILVIFLSFVFYVSAIFGVMILERKVLKTKYKYLGVFIMPTGYALVAFLFALGRLGFVSNILSYLMVVPVFTSSLSCLGEYGMSFFFMLIMSLVSYLFILKPFKLRILFLSSSVILALVPIIVGATQLKNEKEADYVLKVALGTSQYCSFDDSEGITYTCEQEINLFENQMKKAKDNNADLLVLNEEFFYIEAEEEATLKNGISEIIAKYQIPTLACFEIANLEDDKSKNESAYFDKNGNILFSFLKVNFVPFAETGFITDNADPAYIETEIGDHTVKLSSVICFDLNNEIYMQKMNKNTELLLVPSWDWFNCNNEQLRTFVRSSILNVTLVKHTFEGFSYVSTPHGKIIQTIDTRGEYEQVYFVDVPIWTK